MVMGMILQVLEETVTDIGGDGLWDQVTEEAGVSAVYSRFDRYPSSDFLAIVEAVANTLSISMDEAMAIGGEKAFPHLFRRWPDGGASYTDAVSLIGDLDLVIHAEVRTWAPHSDPPTFDIQPKDDGYVVSYTSARGLVPFCQGLLKGAFTHFGTSCDVEIMLTEGTTTSFSVRPTDPLRSG